MMWCAIVCSDDAEHDVVVVGGDDVMSANMMSPASTHNHGVSDVRCHADTHVMCSACSCTTSNGMYVSLHTPSNSMLCSSCVCCVPYIL